MLEAVIYGFCYCTCTPVLQQVQARPPLSSPVLPQEAPIVMTEKRRLFFCFSFLGFQLEFPAAESFRHICDRIVCFVTIATCAPEVRDNYSLFATPQGFTQQFAVPTGS